MLGLLRGLADSFFSASKSPPRQQPGARQAARAAGRPASSGAGTALRAKYPGDFHGTSKVVYGPKPDGAPDPGEIVWTWVPYEEDYSQGKDRPVLLVGREGKWLLALMLTSKDHSSDRRSDFDYIDIGPGAWDRQGRPSEVKLDRILQVAPADLRREGAVLDARRFGAVANVLRQRHGWK
ncbi:hypothetical protein AOC05_07365 [Arthrobacter alpinus]|uniref:PemK-like, MazF-like toxin of type II toxin-antitoxin system n=1 Tax=Arthrobacter alpinus TaxID=656366 RepID=A0A0M3UH93_9MICC|nr:hypothetical protein AOC05_07365 [Arthrobacter alpinus]